MIRSQKAARCSMIRSLMIHLQIVLRARMKLNRGKLRAQRALGRSHQKSLFKHAQIPARKADTALLRLVTAQSSPQRWVCTQLG